MKKCINKQRDVTHVKKRDNINSHRGSCLHGVWGDSDVGGFIYVSITARKETKFKTPTLGKKGGFPF